MEVIRNKNSELRDWGNEQYQRAEDNEREIEIMASKIEELNEEISNLSDQIKDYETQEVQKP